MRATRCSARSKPRDVPGYRETRFVLYVQRSVSEYNERVVRLIALGNILQRQALRGFGRRVGMNLKLDILFFKDPGSSSTRRCLVQSVRGCLPAVHLYAS